MSLEGSATANNVLRGRISELKVYYIDAYKIAVKYGFEGTVEEWLASLIGAAGKDGANGANGKSAYELACDNGFGGSLTEWLASLGATDEQIEAGVVAYLEDHPESFTGILPKVTSADDGKFLRVVGGKWVAETVPSAEGESY